jgi:hypothetical protein
VKPWRTCAEEMVLVARHKKHYALMRQRLAASVIACIRSLPGGMCRHRVGHFPMRSLGPVVARLTSHSRRTISLATEMQVGGKLYLNLPSISLPKLRCIGDGRSLIRTRAARPRDCGEGPRSFYIQHFGEDLDCGAVTT